MVDFTLEDGLAQREKVRTKLLALEEALAGAHHHKMKALHDALGEADPMVLALMGDVFGPFAQPEGGSDKPPPGT